MDDFKNLMILGEKIRNEFEKLQDENLKLREKNKMILAERNNLLVEMNNLLAENERLRKVNETFGKNLQQLPNHFQFIMRDELQKFFAGLSQAAERNFDEQEEKNFVEQDEKISDDEDEENSLVSFENGIEILDAEENLPENIQTQPKKKMIFAEFYAEEAIRN